MFAPARQDKTTDIIVERIRTAILDGKLQPGDRLPCEKELGEQFQVSRQTMREALRALEHLGLITLRKGSGGGAFITAVDQQVAVQGLANYLYFQNLTTAHLSELRRLLEPHAARCAAEHMSPADRQHLEEINRQTRLAITRGDLDQVTRCEIAFHSLIAAQTKNPILRLMLDFSEKLLSDFKKLLKPDQGFTESVLLAHESISRAIAAGDGSTAASEMLDHVVAVENSLVSLQTDRFRETDPAPVPACSLARLIPLPTRTRA